MSDSVPGVAPSLPMRILNITLIVLFYAFATLTVIFLIGIVWGGWREFFSSFSFIYFSMEPQAGDSLQSAFFKASIAYAILLAVVVLVKKYVVDKRTSAAPSAP